MRAARLRADQAQALRPAPSPTTAESWRRDVAAVSGFVCAIHDNGSGPRVYWSAPDGTPFRLESGADAPGGALHLDVLADAVRAVAYVAAIRAVVVAGDPVAVASEIRRTAGLISWGDLMSALLLLTPDRIERAAVAIRWPLRSPCWTADAPVPRLEGPVSCAPIPATVRGVLICPDP